ncbi:MAG: ABC transporter permease [Betaproteobacteria bacterium]
MDFNFLGGTIVQLLGGVPLLLQLAAFSIIAGAPFAVLLALARLSGNPLFDWPARGYVFVFRGTPLLVQIFLIYYGLGQFPDIRESLAWPFLRQPYWCAMLALTLNTAAYSSEIIRSGILSVPFGQIEAARACGMSRGLVFRRIVVPQGLRVALPAYGNEIILMTRATALASVITLMEVTGIASKIVAETFRAIEVFVCAGAIYLAINFAISRGIALLERRLSPQLRDPARPPALAKLAH